MKDWNVTVFILGVGSVPDAGMNRQKVWLNNTPPFLTTVRTRTPLFSNLVAKTSLLNFRFESVLSYNLWSTLGYFGLVGPGPETIIPRWSLQSKHQHWASVKLTQTFMVLPMLHWHSLMWPVAWGHDRLYDFKTIDRGGVCQSHHQELIGPRVPFLITTVTRTPGGDLKSKKFCQCVRQGVMTAKKQTAQVWLIGKNQRKHAFLILGVPVLPAFKMWNKNRSEKGTEFHYFLFWVTWSQPEVSGKTRMADYTRLIPCTPHSHDPRETTSIQNQSYAHSVGGLEPV